jgi:endonuclease-3 related protein
MINLEKIDSYKIYKELEKLDLLNEKPLYRWPNAGNFEVIIGTILTQNTTWINVEKSLKNLKNFLTLEDFLKLEIDTIKQLIKPSGFYNQKSIRLHNLAKNIKFEFKEFEIFKKKVTRKWLLSQKGIGEESADSILCYCCEQNIMVIDVYTKRLLKQFNIEFKNYQQYQDFFHTNKKLDFALFHAMIVEYNKKI